MAYENDVVLSLGDGLRPGALKDAGDPAQIEELITLARLARRAREAGVQVMIEGPGHVPLDEIETQVRMEKVLCDGAPFYVLGPLVTDVAAGYDHITAAIGGAVAAMAGADFLCYVTPKEHLGLPDEKDVRDGVIATRIAAHAADIARRRERFRSWDDEVSLLRAEQNWDQVISRLIDPDYAAEIRASAPPADQTTCSMCGDLCVFKLHRASKQSSGHGGSA
jgi:phosphomethylpyrimidine synthase